MTFALFVIQIGQFIIAVEANSEARAREIAEFYLSHQPEPQR